MTSESAARTEAPLLLSLSTAPSKEVGATIARTLVEQRRAACVSIIPGITSVYRWEGKIEESAEQLLLIKTTPEQYPAMKQLLTEIHPYDTPELVAIESFDVLESYLTWARSGVGEER